jgi:hypothetical protein
MRDMVTPAGLEPATCPLGGGCSIQLSHGASGTVLARTGLRGKGGLGELSGGRQAKAPCTAQPGACGVWKSQSRGPSSVSMRQ